MDLSEIANEIRILDNKGIVNLTKQEREHLIELMDLKEQLEENANKRSEELDNIRKSQLNNIYIGFRKLQDNPRMKKRKIFNLQNDLFNLAYNTKYNDEYLPRPDIFKDEMIDYLRFLRKNKNLQKKHDYDGLIKYFFKYERLPLPQKGRGHRKINADNVNYYDYVDRMDADTLLEIIENTRKNNKLKFTDENGNVYNMKTLKGLKQLFKHYEEYEISEIDPTLINNLYTILRSNTNQKKETIINNFIRKILKDDNLTDYDIKLTLYDYINNNVPQQQSKINVSPFDDLYEIEIERVDISEDKLTGKRTKFINDSLDTKTRIKDHTETESEFKERVKNEILEDLRKYYPVDDIDITLKKIPKHDYFYNENNDCLRVAIKKITGIDYNKDDINGINDFMDKNNKYFGIYNNYGQLITGYLNNNTKNNTNYDLILFDNHAEAIKKGEIQERRFIEENNHNIRFDEIIKIYDIVREHKLIYKGNTHDLNKMFKFDDLNNVCANENININVYIDNDNIKLFDFLEIFLNYGFNSFVYNGNEQKKELLNSFPYFEQLGLTTKEELNEQLIQYDNKEYEAVFENLKNVIKQVEKKEKIIFDSFPYNYRQRSINSNYKQGKTYKAIDMVKAYKKSLISSLHSIYVFIDNVPIKDYDSVQELIKTSTRYNSNRLNNFIFFVDNCERLPRGYFYGCYLEIYKQMEPNAFYEYYMIKNTLINPVKYFSFIEDFLKDDKIQYTKFIGMLILNPTSYHYESETHNVKIKNVKFSPCKTCVMHLNMILKFNEKLLKKIIEIYNEVKILPIGYKIDSILYDDEEINNTPCEFKNMLKKCNEDWHPIKTFDPSNTWESENDINDDIKLNYIFGCAGSGKTTSVIKNYIFGGLVIVKNYMLLGSYENKNIPCALFDQIILNYNYYAINCLYIEEAGTYSNNEINLLLNVAAYHDLDINLIGDYYQLLPITEKGTHNEKLLIEYTKHNYIYKNYRNYLRYDGEEMFIIQSIKRGYFNKDDEIKRDNLLNKFKDYIKIGYDPIKNKNDVVLRWYKLSAANAYKKIEESPIKTPYFMLNNFMCYKSNYINDLSNKNKILKKFDKDTLYTDDQIKGYEKLFINCNVISFYNTQGQTLENIKIVDMKDYLAIIKDPRMFYVMISRIKTNF